MTQSLIKPHLVIVVGISNSGKSYFAERFAESFKAPLISQKRLKNIIGEDITTERCANYFLTETMKTGRTIIFDGNTNTKTARSALMRKAKTAGYRPLVVWMQVNNKIAQDRALKQGMSKETFLAKNKKFSAPDKTQNVIIVNGQHAFSIQLKKVLKSLAETPTMTSIKKPTRQ